MLSFLGGAPFGPDLESAFAKIREALPAKSLPFLSRIQELFSARPDPWKDYSKKQDVIAGLIDAILHQRQARVAYYSFNSRRTKSYDLDPYRLVYYRGGLYLYARAQEYGEVRTFAVERVQKVEVLDQGFEVPADFSPTEYARSAFGIFGGKAETVELVFDAGIAGYVRERNWHESQTLADEADGGVRLTHGGRAQLRPQGLDQGLPAARPGGAARLAARRDRAGDRGRPGRVPRPAPRGSSGRRGRAAG